MTPPVRLVPVAPEHAAPLQRLITGSRDIVAQTRMPDPYPDDGAATWIAFARPRHLRGEQYSFVITDAAGEVVGSCGLVPTADRREAELGYVVGAPYRGRGYATAAARQAVAFAFAEAGVERVFALPLATNAASRRVLEGAGFQLVGLQPAEARWAGQEQARYEVDRAAWATGVSADD